ncbi:MAG TPA: AAA family ATPase [Solirubrobacterales bacterium]|nr:AAA family ATPase [Solirubrobacterales bacterium]
MNFPNRVAEDPSTRPVDSPLLERRAELEVIADQLDQARNGFGSLTVIEGAAGIGKTSLLREACVMAEASGFDVMRSRGGVLERNLEFGVIRQLIEKRLVSSSPERRERLLAGPAVSAKAAIGFEAMPEIPGLSQEMMQNVFHGLYWLLVNASDDGPMLLVIDDAHWSDQASLLAGSYISRRIDGLPVAILVGLRTDEPESGIAEHAAIAPEADAVTIRPTPLSGEAVNELLGGAFTEGVPPPQLIDACLRVTGGNPFYLSELVTALAELRANPTELDLDQVFEAGGPMAVRRSILARMDKLGSGEKRLARAVAILGGEGEIRHAAEIAELDSETAIRAAGILVAAGILQSGRPLRIQHPLITAVVTGEIPDATRALAHRRAFEVLEADGSTDDVLTVHALNSHPSGSESVVRLLRRTASRALASGSASSATIHLTRALAEPPPPELKAKVISELGRAEIREGSFDAGLSHLQASLTGVDEPGLRADIYRDRAFAAFAGSGIEEARGVVLSAISEMADGDADQALQLEVDLAVLAWLSGGEHDLDLERHLGVEGRTRAERTLLALLAQRGQSTGMHPRRIVELATRALGGGRMIHEDSSESLAWYMSVYVLLTCEAHDTARNSINQAIDDSRGRGSAFAAAGAIGARAVLALAEGRPVDAEADALTVEQGGVPPIMAPVNVALEMRALIDQGRFDEAERRMVEGGIEFGPGGPTALRWIPWSRALLREAQGRPDLVRLDVASIEEDESTEYSMKSLPWRAVLARALAAEGPNEEAESLAEEHLAWAKWWDRPAALGTAQRALALAGDPAKRTGRLRLAVDSLGRSALRTEEARARVELGSELCRNGSPHDGRAELETGLELAMAAGARHTAKLAGAGLESFGFNSRSLKFDELTASERRVAEIAASGRTNREIAQELFVTPKTVENHLTKVYAKLGIETRRDLKRVL